MRVQIVRRGGIAGIALSGVVDTAKLPADVAGRAEAALKALPFGKAPSPPRRPDSFQYEISVLEDGERRSAHLNEEDAPADLRPAIEAAVRGGQIL